MQLYWIQLRLALQQSSGLTKGIPMTEAITPQRFILLQMVAKFPGTAKTKLLGLKGVVDADLEYLVKYDLIRERNEGYNVTHLGQMALKRR